MPGVANPEIPPETARRLDAYAALLGKWTRAISLVSTSDRDVLWTRHVEDSLRLRPLIPVGVDRAIDLGSAAIILVHNHPSGDPSPSRADIDLTRAIAAAGKPLNIAVHDHLIIGANGHVSLRAQGLL